MDKIHSLWETLLQQDGSHHSQVLKPLPKGCRYSLSHQATTCLIEDPNLQAHIMDFTSSIFKLWPIYTINSSTNEYKHLQHNPLQHNQSLQYKLNQYINSHNQFSHQTQIQKKHIITISTSNSTITNIL